MNPRLLGEEQECYLFAIQPTLLFSPPDCNELRFLVSDDDNSQSEADSSEADDEGIERDHDENDALRPTPTTHDVVRSVLDACAKHLSDPSEAESHYRSVCRAMVSEAMTFNSFMEKRTKLPDIFEKELDELDRADWAQLWSKTMDSLRRGVKLKKTEHTKTPIEFALTPYEMLMDDIR